MALPSSTLMRRLVPSEPMTRSRSATGLKSTVAVTPGLSISVSLLFIVAWPDFTSMVTILPSPATPYSMPSAGRTSMPRIGPAPLMSTFDATLRVAGSMVTIDLPSTSPTIQPAAWAPVAMKADAASAPASVTSFICLIMEVAPVGLVLENRTSTARVPRRSGAATSATSQRLRSAQRNLRSDVHVFVRRGCGHLNVLRAADELRNRTTGSSPWPAIAARARAPNCASSRSRACRAASCRGRAQARSWRGLSR